jgi:hypothetical protein
MKTICITGAAQPALKYVADLFESAGMKPHQPARRGESVDIGFWHEQVVSEAMGGADDTQPVVNPGRLWDQLASDIFVANIKSKVWGWADSRSTWLLDFWLNFDPHLNFVLICTSPQKILAMLIATGSSKIVVASVMHAWQVHHQELLRFHHRNPQRSLLVDADDCAMHPAALVERCASQWKLPFNVLTESGALQVGYDPLALYLAEQWCLNYPQTVDLQQEIAATSARLGAERAISPVAVSDEIILAYRTLRECGTDLPQVRAVNEELASLSVFLRETALVHEQQKNEANFKLVEVSRVCAEQASLICELQARMEVAEAVFQEGGGVATSALHQAKFESEQYHQQWQDAVAKLQTMEARLADATYELSALTQRRDEQAQLAVDRQVTIERLINTHAENSELLLRELHQSHRKIEDSFLQQKETLNQVATVQARWQRLFLQYPDYVDCELIEIDPATDVENTDVAWRLINLSMAGVDIPVLEFKTNIDQGSAGLIFNRFHEGGSTLLRWPDVVNQRSELNILPAEMMGNDHLCVAVVSELATQDWLFVQKIAPMLSRFLEKTPNLNIKPGVCQDMLLAALDKFNRYLAKIPAVFRFDYVKLKREQVNPDYEHLWLDFDNISFNGVSWAKFEFRISCSNVGLGCFGSFPKLEFPECNKAPFDAWFGESRDDFGSVKLELRFAIPDAMDLMVWQRVSNNDRHFLNALIERLPFILATLKNTGVKITRSWDDWMTMVREIHNILVLRTAAETESIGIVLVGNAELSEGTAAAGNSAHAEIPPPPPNNDLMSAGQRAPKIKMPKSKTTSRGSSSQ